MKDMKGDVHTLLRVIEEDADISMPDTTANVDDILDSLGDDASEALSGAMKTDPDLMSDVLDDSPEALQAYIQKSPTAVDNISSVLDDPEVMDQLSSSPDAVSAMSSYYEENPEDIPDAVVKQITQAVGDDKDTPKGDILEYYEDMLDRRHIDGQPWSGTLQDLASVQGKSFGAGDLVDPSRFDKEVRTSVKFAAGTAKSPLKITEHVLREIIRRALSETSVR